MKKYLLLIGLSVASVLTLAQSESDLLNFSLTDINGSARYVSMSGAFGALGGDMSVLGANPAGIAVYRSSEFSITPSFSFTSAASDFDKNKSSDYKLNAQINNFGYIGSFRTYNESKISNFNFGVSYNKTRNFNRTILVKGTDRTTSLLDRVSTNQEVTSVLDDGQTDLGFMAYKDALISPVYDDVNGNYYKSILLDGEVVNNTMKMKESGGVNEWNLSMGANYGHVFYLGMSLGIQNIDYELKSEYYEKSYLEGVDPFSFNLRNVLVSQGSGVNLKIGVIVRPVPELRLGFAYHTPTYYSMTDVYSASMSSNVVSEEEGDATYSSSINESSQDYQYQTPGLLMYSAAYQFGQKGFLSLDWDIVDYREITLKDSEGFTYDEANGFMNEDFRVASNLRLGGEYRLNDNISLRGGVAWYQSPYKSSVAKNNVELFTVGSNYQTVGTKPQYSIENDTYYLSCGIGYHVGGFFLDAALQHQIRNEYFYNFYDEYDNTAPKYANLDTNRTNFVATIGFKF